MSNKVYVIGDLHGSYHPIKHFYEKYKDNPDFNFDGTDTIILLGDAGLNYYFDHRDDNFKNALCKYPFTYFVIRGNHEERPSNCMKKEPNKWKYEEFWHGAVYVEKRCPKIKYATDTPSSYYIEKLDCLFLSIPGAYSIDKEYRLVSGWGWFSQEQLSLREMLDAADFIRREWDDNFNFDLILSHTAPLKYEPVELFLPFIDQSRVDKSMEEFLDWVDDKINYNLWLWGHYHAYKYYDPKKWDEFDRRKLMLHKDHIIDLEEWLNVKGEGKVL